jgi:hypothetical protein
MRLDRVPLTAIRDAAAVDGTPVQENISGRSTRGSIAFTAARSSSSETGSGSGSRAAKCSRPSSSKTIWALSGTRPATSR